MLLVGAHHFDKAHSTTATETSVSWHICTFYSNDLLCVDANALLDEFVALKDLGCSFELTNSEFIPYWSVTFGK